MSELGQAIGQAVGTVTIIAAYILCVWGFVRLIRRAQ